MTPNSESSCFFRTPSLLKWLLNERAAAAGKLEKTDQRIDRLHHKVTAAQARFQNAQAMLCSAERLRSKTANRLDALDRSIGLTFERVDPKAVGTVNVTGQKYGGRGGLKRFPLRCDYEYGARLIYKIFGCARAVQSGDAPGLWWLHTITNYRHRGGEPIPKVDSDVKMHIKDGHYAALLSHDFHDPCARFYWETGAEAS